MSENSRKKIGTKTFRKQKSEIEQKIQAYSSKIEELLR